jgi:hypothetical protein
MDATRSPSARDADRLRESREPAATPPTSGHASQNATVAQAGDLS